MRIEVRCAACSRRFLLDEVFVGTVLPCPTCGVADGLQVAARAPAPPPASRTPQPVAVAAEPIRRAPVPAAPAVAAPKREASAAVRPAKPVMARAPEPASVETEEVVCPRCKLHFVPRRDATPETGRRTILVVEDMELFRDIAREALAPRFEVKTAGDLAAARAHLAQGPVDLIVLDPKLERGESGVDLLRDLPTKPCPILIYTDQDESEIYGESWERLRRLGADDLVVKGLNAGESLARKVRDLLGESWAEDE